MDLARRDHRHGDRGRDERQLHADRGRSRQDDQGAGELHHGGGYDESVTSEPTASVADNSPAWNPTFSLGYTMLHPRLWDAPNWSMEDKERWASFWPISGQQFEPAGLAAGEKVNFRVKKAYAAQDIGSVRLELTGAHSASRTDNTAPYTLFDDPAGLALPVGSYQISATAYPEPDLGGTPGTTRTATFTLATDTTAPSVRVWCGDDVPTSRSFEVTVVFNEWVLGFALGDISVADANGAPLAHSGSGHGPVNAFALALLRESSDGREWRDYCHGSSRSGQGRGGQPQHGV